MAGFPIRLRARGTASWDRGPWGLQLAVNYTGRYEDPLGVRIDHAATADLQVRYQGRTATPLEGFTASLTVRNLFDADPPFYDNPAGAAYDPANADAVGRFVAVQLARSW